MSRGGVTFCWTRTRGLTMRCSTVSAFAGSAFDVKACAVPRLTTRSCTRRLYISARDRGGIFAAWARCSMELGASSLSTSRSCTDSTSAVDVDES